MFEHHDLDRQIAFLKGIETEENRELVEEIIYDLAEPIQKASIAEAFYQLSELKEKEPEIEDVLELAERLYEELDWPDPERTWSLTQAFQEEKERRKALPDGTDRAMQLQSYFLGGSETELEVNCKGLCCMEAELYRKQTGEDLQPGDRVQTEICQQMLGKRPIYELYPEADARGLFEGTYDDAAWRERYYFGTAIAGGHDWERTLRESDPEYQRYRKQLCQRTIETLCAAYGEEIWQHLPREEQQTIQRRHPYPAFQAGKWKCVLILPGQTYGRSHCLQNKGETLAEFYDCSVSKETFPAGQFVSRYYLQTLCTSDFGSSLKEMAEQGTGFCLDGEVPSWRIDSAELAAIADWLEQQYQKEQNVMEREPAFAEAKPGERTEPDPARSAETMERTSSGTLLPEKSGVIRTR